MQATTGSLRKVEVADLVKTIKRGPLIIVALTLFFIAITILGDKIHQALDPAYRQQVIECEQSQRRLDNLLKQIETRHK